MPNVASQMTMGARIRASSPRAGLALLCACVALVFPASALAFAQYYSQNIYFHHGGFNYSDWNASLNYNEVLFEPLCSLSCLRMQLSLCNTSGQCYAYVGNETGYVQDLRSISYGKAKCQAPSDNFTDTYVYWCYTHN